MAVLAIPGSLFYFREMAPNGVGEQAAEFKVIGGGMMNWCAVQKGINHALINNSLNFIV